MSGIHQAGDDLFIHSDHWERFAGKNEPKIGATIVSDEWDGTEHSYIVTDIDEFEEVITVRRSYL